MIRLLLCISLVAMNVVAADASAPPQEWTYSVLVRPQEPPGLMVPLASTRVNVTFRVESEGADSTNVVAHWNPPAPSSNDELFYRRNSPRMGEVRFRDFRGTWLSVSPPVVFSNAALQDIAVAAGNKTTTVHVHFGAGSAFAAPSELQTLSEMHGVVTFGKDPHVKIGFVLWGSSDATQYAELRLSYDGYLTQIDSYRLIEGEPLRSFPLVYAVCRISPSSCVD